jgi:hypothetical protein
MMSKWMFLLLATAVMSELSADVEPRRDYKHVSRLLVRLCTFSLIGSRSLQIVRGEQHSRQTRAALKPLGFFGKLAYMGGLLFQVSISADDLLSSLLLFTPKRLMC